MINLSEHSMMYAKGPQQPDHLYSRARLPGPDLSIGDIGACLGACTTKQ